MFRVQNRASSLLLRVGVGRCPQRVADVVSRSIFYECAPFGVVDSERVLVERSFKAGCDKFFTRSSAFATEIYDALADIEFGIEDESARRKLTLGHIAQPPKSAQSHKDILKSISEELSRLEKAMTQNKQSLQYLTLQLPSFAWKHPQHTKVLFTELTEKHHSFLRNPQQPVHLGLDFSTRLLSEVPLRDLVQTTQFLIEIKQVKCMTLATNAFTYKASQQLLQHLHLPNPSSSSSVETPQLMVFATEVLRSHRVKPGQLSPDYAYKEPHIVRLGNGAKEKNNSGNNSKVIDVQERSLSSTTSSSGHATLEHTEQHVIEDAEVVEEEPDVSPEEWAAVSDLRHAFDRAVVLEKKLMEKHAEQVQRLHISLPDICSGHLLTHLHSPSKKDASKTDSIDDRAKNMMRKYQANNNNNPSDNDQSPSHNNNDDSSSHNAVEAPPIAKPSNSGLTFVEEYDFLVANRLQVAFEVGGQIISKQGDVDLRNWLALYRPVQSYLIASYRHLLQIRQGRWTQDLVTNQLSRLTPSSTVTATRWPYYYASAMLEPLNAHVTHPSIAVEAGLSLMIVSPAEEAASRREYDSNQGHAKKAEEEDVWMEVVDQFDGFAA